jgi:hypothetical protein
MSKLGCEKENSTCWMVRIVSKPFKNSLASKKTPSISLKKKETSYNYFQFACGLWPFLFDQNPIWDCILNSIMCSASIWLNIRANILLKIVFISCPSHVCLILSWKFKHSQSKVTIVILWLGLMLQYVLSGSIILSNVFFTVTLWALTNTVPSQWKL